MLGLLCGFTVRDDAMPRNAVRDVQGLPMPEKKTAALTSEQVRLLLRRCSCARKHGAARHANPADLCQR